MTQEHNPTTAMTKHSERDVVLDIDKYVATITICNESRYNAMAYSMWLKLGDIMEGLSQQADIRVLVVRGAGEKAFVSGADISEFGERRNDPDQVALYDQAVSRAQSALTRFPAPVITAISGICYGGGLGLILSSDLRFAGMNSKFRMPAGRLGLGYAYDGIKRMAMILGVAKASELFYTANVYSASEALGLGLVNSVHENVFEYSKQVAHIISQNAPLTLAAAKTAFQTFMGGSREEDIRQVDQAVRACFASDDYKEGRAAFAEKRDPLFRGK